jgi:hypothetical protein
MRRWSALAARSEIAIPVSGELQHCFEPWPCCSRVIVCIARVLMPEKFHLLIRLSSWF